MSNAPFELTPFDDGYVEEPPAPKPPSMIEALAQSRQHRPGVAERACLQLGHRLAIAATLLLAGAMATTLMRHAAHWPLLLLAFLASDAALLFGVIAAWLQQVRPQRTLEPLGIAIFSFLLLMTTIVLTILVRSGWLTSLIARAVGES